MKSVPTPFDKIKAVNTLGKLLLRGCSIDDLSLEDHLIWLSLQSLILGDDFNQGMDNVTLSSGLQSLTFGRESIRPCKSGALCTYRLSNSL